MKENVKVIGVEKLLNEIEEGKQFDMKYFSYEKPFRQKQESQKVEESNIWRDRKSALKCRFVEIPHLCG